MLGYRGTFVYCDWLMAQSFMDSEHQKLGLRDSGWQTRLSRSNLRILTDIFVYPKNVRSSLHRSTEFLRPVLALDLISLN